MDKQNLGLQRIGCTWQAEMSLDTEAAEIIRSELFEDRVYVFTPAGEVLKLSKGATPLDFAYSVHTDVGHHCRGAKVDGRMVPLTSTLSNGQQVEILTAKTGGPSRDWLNSHLGYLKTAQARVKVHQWLKKQDRAKNATEGRNLLEKELRRLAVHSSLDDLAQHLKFPKAEDLFVALGGGEIKLQQVIQAIVQIEPLKTKMPLPPKLVTARRQALSQMVKRDPISVAGVGNLLCQTAKCCKPIPGDDIIGYIVAGRGVSVHRKDCANILEAGQKNRTRLIEVRWEGEAQPSYRVDLTIHAYDRQGLIRDIGALLASEKINVMTFKTHLNKTENTIFFSLTVEVPNLSILERLFGQIHQLPNIIDCRRVQG
jgi:GTP pyrophosphokinase